MAEVVLSAFLQVLFDKLASPMLEEYGLWSGAKEEREQLENTLTTIQAVLEDAEERQVKEKAVQNWLTKLKDAVYDADDVLDEFATEALRRKVGSDNDKKYWVRHYISSFSKSVVFGLKLGHKVKKINERLVAIALERVNFHFREGVTDMQREDNDREQTHSFVIESEVIGREKDKEDIVHMLIGLGNQEDISVIPVVGMGGIGKTTLAQLAFNDVRVMEYFKLRMWVCVSEGFDVRNLTKAIIEAASRKKCDLLAMDLLQTRLRETLAGERFLLVLDDVWSEDHDKWDRLKTLLRGGAKGSKIIVTTRSEEVAAIMGSLSTCYLNRLLDDDCWSLFKKRAFEIGGAEETPKMVAIGREIVKKCGGVPLAVNTLGSLMRSRREEHEWLFVKNNEIWKLPQERDRILPALRISYNHLPSNLKRCFAYCAVFPKDYKIVKEELIQMWIAEGFVAPCEGDRQLEDIGSNYFNYLLWRSFFQDAEKDDDGNIVSCKIHDLMHDLAQFVSGDECSIVEADSKQIIPKRTRHLALIPNEMVITVPQFSYRAKKLHTFLLLTERRYQVSIPRTDFSTSRYLHVLNLSYINAQSLPNSIGELKHLRLLDLSHSDIGVLPKSISSLLNLRTLNLSCCYELQKLPKYTRNLISLRHIKIDHCYELDKMPSRIGKLTSLQTLSKFIVGEECGHRMEELKWLNLRGELTIQNLENVRYARDAREAKLEEKHYLSSLKLLWNQDYVSSSSVEVFEEVLEALKPHKNLKRFCLRSYHGVKFPTWMMGATLTNIVEISFWNCRRCEHLPPLGQLPLLKFLNIRYMDAVTNISSEFYGDGVVKGFPSLKHLEFHDMPNFEEWLNLDGSEVLPCINKLVVIGCPKLRSMPHVLSSLEELDLRMSNEMLLRAVPSLTSLTTLRICGFSEVRSLPREVENLTNLKSLDILDFPSLVELPEWLGSLKSLRILRIGNCPNLTSLPNAMQSLSSLKSLSIWNCPNLKQRCEKEEGRGLANGVKRKRKKSLSI